MSDFNPLLRQEQNFRLPPKPKSPLGEAYSFLVSILSTPVTIRGVDLSHWQGNVDFAELKASGIEFVILKATEGIDWVDEKFNEYWQSAHALELPIMPYHFFRSNYGGSPQATHHVDTLKASGFIDTVSYKSPVVWADVETADGATVSQRRNRLLAFHETAAAKGYQSGHYSSPYLWNSLIGSVPWASDYWGWDAHWTSASEPILPLGWTKNSTRVWQYGIYPTHAWVEPVKGVSGAVDCDYFYGTLQQLKDWLGVTPPMECCEELFAEVKKLEEKIEVLRIKTGVLEEEISGQEVRLLKIEGLIQSAKDIFCN